MPWLSVVIPVFNEARRFPRPLRSIGEYLAARPFSAEVVVVDDGSSDDTFDVVCQAVEGWTTPVRVFRYERNRGKGHALKLGFAQASGHLILFTDADLSTPIAEADRLLRCLDDGVDIAIGSRKAPGAQIDVHQGRLRENMGRVFTWLVRNLIADVADATCGFKAFRNNAGKEIFRHLRIDDWSFDAEVMMLARHLGYRLQEVPVQWADRAGSKVRLGRDVIQCLYDLFRIRCNLARGVYDSTLLLPTESTSREFVHDPRETAASAVERMSSPAKAHHSA